MDQRTLQANAVTIIFTIVALILLVATCMKQRRQRTTRLPPGPSTIPFLGNIPQLDMSKPYRSFKELSTTYGSVFTVWLASKAVVVISGYDAIREALVNQGEAFNGRGTTPINVKILNGYSVGVSNGPRWKVLRAFSEGSLTGFGMGCKSLEERVQEEARCLVRAFDEGKDSAINPKELLFHSIINLFCSIVLGQRFEHAHPTFQIFYNAIFSYFDFNMSRTGTLYSVVPRIVSCFPGKHQVLFRNVDNLRAFIRQEADRRLKDLDTLNPKDYLDVFLVRMLEEKEQPQTEFQHESMFGCVWDLFAAGTETQGSTLAHGLLVMIGHPLIQGRVQEEIDDVIGQGRPPAISDRVNMPYTNAVIHEIQRTMNLAPIAVPHMMNHGTEYYGHHIPEGTTVFPLMISVLSDPKLFKNPDLFDPENFLDEDGRFRENDGFIAYGLGKRGCLGNAMGIPRMVIFLFFTSVLQRFSLRGTRPAEEIDIRTVPYAFGQLARPYTCYAEPRG